MRKILAVVVVMMATGPALVLGQASETSEVLADMQAALGGADQLAAVRTLTAAGTVYRVTARGGDERGIELAMELPATFVARRVLTGEGATAVYRNIGFDGESLVEELDAPPDLNISGLQQRLAARLRVQENWTSEDREEAAARQLNAQKAYFARVALGMLGSSYEVFPVHFSYAGLAESPDGSAHTLTVEGTNGFQAQLFVDAQSGLPLMLRWKRPAAGGTTTDSRYYYSDFKSVGDLNLPHAIQWTVDGEVREQMTFEEIVINSEIDHEKFSLSR